MKKLINNPLNVVPEMIDGLVGINPHLVRLSGHHVVLRADIEEVCERQVSLISGGGSGHEPAHAGFVGRGMLSAAVLGEVFTSPSSDAVLAAIRATAGKPGVLLIVKNYTGDRLNFGLAAEMARAEGIAVEVVIVSDDVATASSDDETLRRGIAGTIFVHKIAGAVAAEGRPLREVARIAREAASEIGTMGVSLAAGIVPAAGTPGFTLADDEMELGLGIHGEPGIRRIPMQDADSVTRSLVDQVLGVQRIIAGDRVALLVNNLGSTTPMELAIVARTALHYLKNDKGLFVDRAIAGTLMTSLEMAGVSISLLRLTDERLVWLDAPTDAPAWPRLPAAEPVLGAKWATPTIETLTETIAKPAQPNRLEGVLRDVCAALMANEEHLTALDQAAGDGDLGVTLSRGAHAVLHDLQTYPLENVAETLHSLALTLQRALGGSSGPLYGVLLLRLSASLKTNAHPGLSDWASAMAAGAAAVAELGAAKAGDRTMLDALLPFTLAFRRKSEEGAGLAEALRFAAEEAEKGADATARMQPRRGRSAYLGDRVIGVPDPGAIAVALWLKAVADNFSD